MGFLILIVLLTRPSFAETYPSELTRAFLSSCKTSFARAEKGHTSEFASRVCECIPQESVNQGVTAPSLRAESEKIRTHPGYEIQDEKLMNAFRACAIEVAHADAD